MYWQTIILHQIYSSVNWWTRTNKAKTSQQWSEQSPMRGHWNFFWQISPEFGDSYWKCSQSALYNIWLRSNIWSTQIHHEVCKANRQKQKSLVYSKIYWWLSLQISQCKTNKFNSAWSWFLLELHWPWDQQRHSHYTLCASSSHLWQESQSKTNG